MSAPRAIGKFQVLGTLGQGAQSAILHIRCQNDGRQYALKVVPIEDKEDQKYYDQAEHEFQVGQLFDHPNLIKVYAFEPQRDWLFRVKKVHLLIEYVNGKTLDTVQGLTVPRLVQLFARIAAGLAHMHRRGVCHADLKPSNVMLSRTGDVKIIDYGLAWIKGQPKGRVQGTPEYMAPEQVKHGMVNERTDIYNFGATMYRLTTWRHPPSTMAGAAVGGMTSSIFKGLLKPVQQYNPQAPPPLCDLIHGCLSYQPDKRPERVNDILDQLKAMEQRLVRSPSDSLDSMEW
jgi:serine/threonine protein kinase